MDQTLINWLLGGFGGLIGFLLHMIWQAVKDLQKADTELAAKVGEIEVLVAGAYVKRTELDAHMSAIMYKLDKIVDKLDTKVDKH